MPQLQPFPEGFLDKTAESHLAQYNRKTSVIYWLILAACVAGVVALPFLYVDVSVNAGGSFRAVTHLNYIRPSAQGFVRQIHVQDNMDVRAGQSLIEVVSPLVEEREQFLGGKIAEAKDYINDLRHLEQINTIRHDRISDSLKTPLYQQSLHDYKQRLLERQLRSQKAKADYDRNKKLFEQGVIAKSEFENVQFEWTRSQHEIEMLLENQRSLWAQEMRTLEKELADFTTQFNQVQQEKSNLNIVATVNGTVQGLTGLYPGSPVFPNQELGYISPDTSLVAIVYVTPADVGLLQKDMLVRMQVAAFNYHDWGLATGQIIEISDDIHMVNNQPVFEVKCSLYKNFLKLRNGYKGKLKKGMNFQARFVVTSRSLWDLLYDKVDNWMNPNIEG